MFRATQFYRAKDWPLAMEAACTRYERAIEGVANAWTADVMEQALAELSAAKQAFGAHVRQLDMKRRPDVYGR